LRWDHSWSQCPRKRTREEKRMNSRHAERGLAALRILATLAGVIGLVAVIAPAIADQPASANFVFLNDTGQEANDLHVLFNTDMTNSVIGWQGQGTNLPIHSRVGSWVHLSGASVPDQNGTEFRFAAMVPDGQDLEVLEAYWTEDGENIGPASYHRN